MTVNVILRGIVGSTAYGLNNPNSDIDMLGTFVYDHKKYMSLDDYDESIVKHDPDVAMHEARKYCKLALKCNPTITELMWLDSYETKTMAGEALIAIRDSFLSERYVREAYLGYAKSQLTRLQDRDSKRAQKHAMHMARLVNQGAELYTCGELTIKVDDPEWYIDFKNRDPEYWLRWYNTAEKIFKNSKCVLPENPDKQQAERWYYSLRIGYAYE